VDEAIVEAGMKGENSSAEVCEAPGEGQIAHDSVFWLRNPFSSTTSAQNVVIWVSQTGYSELAAHPRRV
jgi:hypothetical protein